MKGFTLEVGGTRSQELKEEEEDEERTAGMGILKRRRVPRRIHRVSQGGCTWLVTCETWPSLLFVDQSGQRRNKHGGGAAEEGQKRQNEQW